MTCKLAVTENEIFPKPRNKSRVLCQLKQILQSGKNGHREPDEMERVFAETQGEKKKIKESDGETCEPESEAEKGGRAG